MSNVFISYRKKLYLRHAESLTSFLASRGYDVWLDQEVLPRGIRWSKHELQVILREAARGSQCSVVFEITLEREMAVGSHPAQPEHSSDAWSWPVWELEASSLVIAVHPTSGIMYAYRTSEPHITSPRKTFDTDAEINDLVLEFLQELGIQPTADSDADNADVPRSALGESQEPPEIASQPGGTWRAGSLTKDSLWLIAGSLLLGAIVVVIGFKIRQRLAGGRAGEP